jgi:hypothetical protein
MSRGPRGVLSRCPQNHKVFRLEQIEGTYSEDFKCDARCLNAKARKCTCSCGGMNHGRGHAVQIVPVTPPARMRSQLEGGTLGDKQPPMKEYSKQHLGEVGEKVYFEAKLTRRIEGDDSTLYVFLTEVRTPITNELLGEAEIKWWKPSYVDDPGFGPGEVYKLKAKVKRLDDDPKWGKSIIVTYLEEV